MAIRLYFNTDIHNEMAQVVDDTIFLYSKKECNKSYYK